MTTLVATVAATGQADHVGGPVWIAYVVPAVLFAGSICASIWLLVWSVRQSDAGEDDDDGGGGGGGDDGRPPTPPPRPDTDPDWWPEFERQFEAYVRGRLSRSR